AALAFLLVLPHLVWQLHHGWPTLEFVANARLYKIAYGGPLPFLGEAALMVGPPSLLIWLPGLAWLLLRGAGGRYRAVGLSLLGVLLFLAFQPSKAYYASPIFVVLFAAGSVALEDWKPGGRWLMPAVGALLVAATLATGPLFLPLLPPENTAAWGRRLGFVPAGGERHGPTVLPQYFADRFGWEEMAAEVARIWSSIPPAERDTTLVLTSNYGEAGALRYWAERYHLPPAASQHNNFFLWGADKDLDDVTTVLAVGIDPGDLAEAFREVTPAGELHHPFAMPYETGPILWIARHPKVDLEESWQRGKSYI
ncbi:MAG: hypothetical protein R3234_12290, partial [Thermoanaerobaculia bacterium]|nr:hypothetical protein [Thermoanaerobaculia bacterium]